jgi:hypothetical protein
MIKALKIIFFLNLLFETVVVSAQPPLVKRNFDDRSELLVKTYGGNERSLYQSSYDYLSNINLLEYSNSTFIGALENNANNSAFVLLDESGKQFGSENIVSYSFDPLSPKVALAKLTDEHFDMIIYDILSNEVIEINMLHYYPLNLHWVNNKYDNSIYFRSRDVQSNFAIIKYDVIKCTFEQTDLPSFNFSPSGEYYAVSSFEAIEYGTCKNPASENEESCFSIYDRNSNKLVEYSNQQLGEPYDWVYEDGEYFMFKKYTSPIVERFEVNKRTRERIVGYDSPKNTVFNVKSGDKVQEFDAIVLDGSYTPDSWFYLTKYVIGLPAGKKKLLSKSETHLIIKSKPVE